MLWGLSVKEGARTWRQLAAIFGEQEAKALFGLTNVLVGSMPLVNGTTTRGISATMKTDEATGFSILRLPPWRVGLS